ncbi:hypothetical protein [Streptomyces sp. MMG1121]|uniref:hypothetical protein n=1 Tax=Streptomyces sp. MMG1121 TaxID=1415544 RepID=UPI0006AF2836|nr:hypothetical protein [Streptomyces sp. MMG1121]KOV58092.1 hypothetical protein ADK64_36845 [Streptomyces sp. MMG1121]
MTSPSRYHLLLTTGGRPVQHGWWGREVVARDKFRNWVGLYGGAMPGARVTLSDEDSGDVLDAWPDHR